MSGQLNPKRLRIALGLLFVGVAVFGWSMYGYLFGGSAQLEPAEGAFVMLDEDEESTDSSDPQDHSAGDEESDSGTRILEDLLAKHGSFDRRTEVRSPFKWILPPAPIVEVAKKPETKIRKNTTGDKAGKKPSALRVTMTFRAGQIQRAVVDGAVVGVGDRVATGVVMGIRANGIEVDTGPKVVFFEITQPGAGGESAQVDAETNNKEGDK